MRLPYILRSAHIPIKLVPPVSRPVVSCIVRDVGYLALGSPPARMSIPELGLCVTLPIQRHTTQRVTQHLESVHCLTCCFEGDAGEACDVRHVYVRLELVPIPETASERVARNMEKSLGRIMGTGGTW
jgi:hypothetical protein